MGEHVVASVDDVAASDSIIVEIDGRSIGLFNVDGEYFALLNRCAHQGGPLCTGGVFPLLDATVEPDGSVREYFARDRWVIACPWHGWEYDIRTGVCMADPSRRVRTFPTEVRDGKVIVTTPASTSNGDRVSAAAPADGRVQ